MNELYGFYTDIYEGNKRLIQDTKEVSHPISMILQEALKEQQAYLEKLIPMLKDDWTLDEIKEPVTIIYHNFDAVKPLFNALMRAVNWVNIKETSVINDLKHVLPGMKKNLEAIAEDLEKRFGAEKIKYIVPSFYSPRIR
ncbi:hypothetical protein [Bacillus sp. NEB1478]|uniref:hypothetical protein n=1 Tax=Bacillus sp. NEB1478 TaxID=3073816 RepID=UPI0028731A4B|nr:hypothetical protein [Bacillus sp. NEB1478]WNB91077.1 hypothetical protein RGB74_14335 [Bacillus sp. NEB1478]